MPIKHGQLGNKLKHLATICLFVLTCFAGNILAGEISAKDMILSTLSGSQTGYEGVSITVIVLNPDGTTSQRAPTETFYTGERFRIKLVSTADGELSVSNTNTLGITRQLLTLPIVNKTEITLPGPTTAFAFTGSKGTETLSLVVTPSDAKQDNSATAKDILLITQSTADTAYQARPVGSGTLNTTLTIHHQ